MTDNNDFERRIADLKQRIDQAEEKMKQRVMLHKDHQATIDGLRKRCVLLQQQLADATASAEAKGHHVDSFEKTLLRWINTLTFDQ